MEKALLFCYQGDLPRNGIVGHIYFYRKLFRAIKYVFDDGI